MNETSKALAKKAGISLVVLLVGVTVLRTIFPWILLCLAIYGIWCLLNRK